VPEEKHEDKLVEHSAVEQQSHSQQSMTGPHSVSEAVLDALPEHLLAAAALFSSFLQSPFTYGDVLFEANSASLTHSSSNGDQADSLRKSGGVNLGPCALEREAPSGSAENL
jgi:hypothetical protein